jgi:uncharacterized glyoxalase superfamily protein PhnB
MVESPGFRTPSVGLFTRDVDRLVQFYQGFGFRETYRYAPDGKPHHVEVKLDALTLAISLVDAAVQDHGLQPDLGGHSAYLVIWSDDADAAYARAVALGARSLTPPRDFLTNLRNAWVEDPDGNSVVLVQRRG